MTLRIDDLHIGDRVIFERDASAGCAVDDPLYQPPIPRGATAIVVKIGRDHIRVRLDDPHISPDPVRVWQNALFPDMVTNTLDSLKKA